MNLIQKGVCLILLLAVVFLAGVCWFELRTIDDLTARNAELNGALQAIDLKAKTDAITYKENSDAIKTKYSSTVASLNARYDRLLHAKGDTGSGNPSESTEGVNGTTEEYQTAINFERACALDANHVILFQEWVRLNSEL